MYFCLFIVLTGGLLAVKLLQGIVWSCYGFVRSYLTKVTFVCTLICIDLHVLLSEWRNGTCASPIDFNGIKRALLCILALKACGSACVTENGDRDWSSS